MMEDNLIQLLESFGYPVRRQGSMPESYPDAFFTFWNTDSPDHAHYDNKSYGTAWAFNVFFYATDPALAYQMISAARDLLKDHGWVVPSKGFDAASDEPTHTGRAITAQYLEV